MKTKTESKNPKGNKTTYSNVTQSQNSLVSVICPTIRPENRENLLQTFVSQDYENKELIIIEGEDSIGNKRNRGCADAKGDIIIHMDDDDYYSPDYITKSVDFLVNNHLDLTGLSSAYFYNTQTQQAYEWVYTDATKSMVYVCEASMCYYKRVWERRQFKDTYTGEGLAFLAHLPNIKAHNHKNSFVAMLHGSNTASHMAVNTFKPIDVNIVTNILSL